MSPVALGLYNNVATQTLPLLKLPLPSSSLQDNPLK